MTRSTKLRLRTAAVLLTLISPAAFAGFQTTSAITTYNILADNGVVYISGFTTLGNCAFNRLEIRETGDFFNHVENANRMMAILLSAKLSGKAVSFVYNDTDGPGCRLEGLTVSW